MTSTEVVALCWCVRCNTVLINPDPLPGEPQYPIVEHAMKQRLIWNDDELEPGWECPECQNRELWDYKAQEKPAVQAMLTVDADLIDWAYLREQKFLLSQDDVIDNKEIMIELIELLQQAAIDSGARLESEVLG